MMFESSRTHLCEQAQVLFSLLKSEIDSYEVFLQYMVHRSLSLYMNHSQTIYKFFFKQFLQVSFS